MPTGLMALRSQRLANPLRDPHRARAAGGLSERAAPLSGWGHQKKAGSREQASHGSPAVGFGLPATSFNVLKTTCRGKELSSLPWQDRDRWRPLPRFTVQPQHSHPRLCDVSLLPCTAHLAPTKTRVWQSFSLTPYTSAGGGLCRCPSPSLTIPGNPNGPKEHLVGSVRRVSDS